MVALLTCLFYKLLFSSFPWPFFFVFLFLPESGERTMPTYFCTVSEWQDVMLSGESARCLRSVFLFFILGRVPKCLVYALNRSKSLQEILPFLHLSFYNSRGNSKGTYKRAAGDYKAAVCRKVCQNVETSANYSS